MDVTHHKTRSSQRLTRWHLFSCAAVAGIGCVAVADALRDIWERSLRDEGLATLLLIPLVALWLVWVRRRRLRRFTATGLWAGPALLIAGWVLYVAGHRASWLSAWHLGAILVVAGCAVCVLGREALMGLLPAFAAMLFVIPLPERLEQLLTMPLESSTQAILNVVGSDTYRSLAAEDRARDSEGVRMTAAIVLVAYAFVFGAPFRPYVRTLVLLSSPMVAVVCNVVLWLIVSQADAPTSEYTAGELFRATDWAMLPLSLLLLLGLTYLLRMTSLPLRRFRLAHD